MRRIHSAHRRENRILKIGLLALIISVMIVGCVGKKGPHKRLPGGGKRIPSKDIIRPAEQRPPEAAETTPQRAASQELVKRGLFYIDQKNYDLAAVRFQDAINVDPRNGEAYYYMALADYYIEQYDVAVGLLDKAKALLNYDPTWVEKIENLRASILADDSAGAPTRTPEF